MEKAILPKNVCLTAFGIANNTTVIRKLVHVPGDCCTVLQKQAQFPCKNPRHLLGIHHYN